MSSKWHSAFQAGGLLPDNDAFEANHLPDITAMEQAPERWSVLKRKERALRKGMYMWCQGGYRPRSLPGKVLYTTEVAVAQLGALESLGKALFTARDKRTAISFHTSNSAIAGK